jgi:hypothetical protein
LGGQAGIDEAGLKSLTGRTGGQYAYVTDAATLTNLYQQYGQSFQSEYAITYVTPSTTRDGVNRGLTVSLSTAGVSAEGKYNPGGVLPEVTSVNWTLFAAIGLGLLVLLFVPCSDGRWQDARWGWSWSQKRKDQAGYFLGWFEYRREQGKRQS